MLKKLLIISIAAFLGSCFIAYAQVERPAFPTNVKAVPGSICSLDLTWGQVDPGAFSHRYYWSTDNFQFSNNLVELPQAGKNYPDTPPGKTGVFQERLIKLTPQTKYAYKVQSCSPSGCSELKTANGGYAAELPALPEKPEAPQITVITGTPKTAQLQDIKVSWSAVTGLSPYGGYALYMSQNGGPYQYIAYRPVSQLKANGDVDFALQGAALFHQENALALDADYAFMVRAYESGFGCSVFGEDPIQKNNQLVYSEYSSAASLPYRPLITEGKTVSIAPAKIQINFDDRSSNETAFEILRSVDGADSTYSLPANSDQFVDSNVVANKVYTYSIRACFKTIACSPYSQAAVVAVGIEKPIIKSRIIYTERSESANKSVVQIYWSPITGATSYELSRRLLPNGEFSAVLSGNKTSLQEVLSFGNYEYIVKALKGGEEMSSDPVTVSADPKMILSGHGWGAVKGSGQTSPVGLGWVTFNSKTNPHFYSVQADANGLFSGLGWTSYGWLSFNKDDLKGCPMAPCEARVLADGSFTGWARFLARAEDSSPGAWLGWLKLSGFTLNNKKYGLQYVKDSESPDYRKIIGAAWGGDVVGYVTLGGAACLYCNVSGDDDPKGGDKPIVKDVAVSATPPGDEWCAEAPAYTVSWSFVSNNQQTKAVVNFIDLSTGAAAYTGTVTIDKSFRLDDVLTRLRKNAFYRVSVVASDSQGDSEPAYSSSFQTPSHMYPFVKFSYDPVTPKLNQLVTFKDESMDRSGGSYPITQWSWDFSFAEPTKSSDRNPEVVFKSFPATVSLAVTDQFGSQCIGELEIDGSATSVGSIKRRKLFER